MTVSEHDQCSEFAFLVLYCSLRRRGGKSVNFLLLATFYLFYFVFFRASKTSVMAIRNMTCHSLCRQMEIAISLKFRGILCNGYYKTPGHGSFSAFHNIGAALLANPFRLVV